jgi:hypothetical protein
MGIMFNKIGKVYMGLTEILNQGIVAAIEY